jgi:hypothetical protein
VINPKLFPYGPVVRWERLFEDLEGQLAAEWESERAALDSEGERLRLSRVRLHDRLVALAGAGVREPVGIALTDRSTLRGTVEAVGVDFLAVRLEASTGGLALVRTAAIAAITTSEVELMRSARREAQLVNAALADRLTLGFVLRDLARRRVPARLHALSGEAEFGTIDRVGVDHLDFAVHDAGAARRTGEVRAFRLVPFSAIAWLMLERGESPALL